MGGGWLPQQVSWFRWNLLPERFSSMRFVLHSAPPENSSRGSPRRTVQPTPLLPLPLQPPLLTCTICDLLHQTYLSLSPNHYLMHPSPKSSISPTMKISGPTFAIKNNLSWCHFCFHSFHLWHCSQSSRLLGAKGFFSHLSINQFMYNGTWPMGDDQNVC